MADDVNEVNGDSDEHGQPNDDPNQKKSAKHDSGAADLEKVTDYAEEKEIFSTDDNDEFKGAMSIIGDRRNKEVAEKMAKERELLKVAIKKEDVDLIVSEFEIARPKAERILREHHGDVVEALTALTN
ncbi:huntingtin-interacting protein K [Cimex lectularius]|uniref:Nascent polypeptide-associated complex subunit alpha-like UBA domain-containing protein n=1 Tax=Cimex lectularius TaxID=79782 RepID=A0A8I6TD46_CIMLE|nr:huntingtin-interacting protein K [Cimex lectularius]